MKIQPTQTNNPTFGVYKTTKITSYGERKTGVLNGCKLDIYTAEQNGKIAHKLYYLADKAGNWVKSKLIYFSGNKKFKVIKSERKKS